jgi:hypothetical protein
MMWNRKRNQDQGSGIHNTGTMSGVQNQPGAIGSIQSQGATAPDPNAVQNIADGLTRLRAALDAQRDRVDAYDQCTAFVDLAAQDYRHRCTDPGTRTVHQRTRARQPGHSRPRPDRGPSVLTGSPANGSARRRGERTPAFSGC